MAKIRTLPGAFWSDVTVDAAALDSNVQNRRAASGPITVTTTVAKTFPLIAPCTGTISGIKFYGTDALAAHDSNYITFTATNIGQAGSGTTVLLAATDANTTKATGGTAIAANTPRNLTLTGTSANLAVTSGDLIVVTVTPTGTLANTITGAGVTVNFTPS